MLAWLQRIVDQIVLLRTGKKHVVQGTLPVWFLETFKELSTIDEAALCEYGPKEIDASELTFVGSVPPALRKWYALANKKEQEIVALTESYIERSPNDTSWEPETETLGAQIELLWNFFWVSCQTDHPELSVHELMVVDTEWRIGWIDPSKHERRGTVRVASDTRSSEVPVRDERQSTLFATDRMHAGGLLQKLSRGGKKKNQMH